MDYDQIADLYELKLCVQDFFNNYLDIVEVSDSGKEFHPITISCCRSMKIDPLNKLLKRMKELAKQECPIGCAHNCGADNCKNYKGIGK